MSDNVNCMLKSLSSSKLAGIIPGLKFGDSHEAADLQLDPAAFPCCGGNGQRAVITAPQAPARPSFGTPSWFTDDRATTMFCGLPARLRATAQVAALYAKYGSRAQAHMPAVSLPQLLLQASHSALLANGLRALSGIATGERRYGCAWTVTVPLAAEGESGTGAAGSAVLLPTLWALALAATWRFGMRSHVVLHGATAAADVLPKAGVKAPQVIFLGNIDQLWEAYQADVFSAVIGYAYSAVIPVFMEFTPKLPATPGPELAAVAATRTSLARRLGQLKGKAPLAWLTEETVSKAMAVTNGLATLAPRPSRRQEAPRNTPRLPWDP